MQRTVAEFKAYIIGQNLPPAIKNLQRVDDMLPQVKYRFKRAEQLKVEFGLLSKEDIILKPPPANEEEVRKEFAEAELENEAICAMNGGRWPTNPPADGQMSMEEASALQKDAQRRIDAIRAAYGGQLPADWRERIATNRP